MGKRFYKPPRMVNYRIRFSVVILGGFFVFMTPEMWLEIFGYVGTVIVIASFFMTDIKFMRIINMVGGIITMIYAIIRQDNPVILLNAAIVSINTVQLLRLYFSKKKQNSEVNSGDGNAYNVEEKKEENI